MIKMFNTTNRTSRFSARDYCDIVEIYLQKFTRIIQNIISILFLLLKKIGFILEKIIRNFISKKLR